MPDRGQDVAEFQKAANTAKNSDVKNFATTTLPTLKEHLDMAKTDHAKVAEAFGVKSFRVFDPSKLGSVLKEAISSERPTLVDIVCQPLHEARAPVSEWVA